MNLVLDDAVEVNIKDMAGDQSGARQIGRILLKGDNVAAIQQIVRTEN